MDSQIITINVPYPYLKAFDTLIDLGLYKSRSQLVRVCLGEFLDKDQQFCKDLNDDVIQDMEKIKGLNNGV